VKEIKPDAKVTILHRDIRVYSMEEELLSEALEKGVEFIRVSDDSSREKSGAPVELKADKELFVTFTELQSKSQKNVTADYVVLSTGLRPQGDVSELAGLLSVDIDERGYFKEIHSELRPVESSRKGICICGLAHSPQTAQDIVAQAKAAAMKVSSTVRRGNRKV
jgi:heterodisulfide reductase subunit A-like polyferredoxin